MQENADDYNRFINDQNWLNMLFFFFSFFAPLLSLTKLLNLLVA